MLPPTPEESTEVVLELLDELLSLLAICEKTGDMGQAEAHRLYKHYAKMTSRYAAQGEVTPSWGDLGREVADLSPNGKRER